MCIYSNRFLQINEQNGWTPLITACFNGQLKIVRILIEAGADKEKAEKVNL